MEKKPALHSSKAGSNIMAILVSKADGTAEAFDPSKLQESLFRAGATPDVAVDISRTIERGLYTGITTQEIYRRAFALVREHRRGVAARYSLKRAVLQFGPSGFPFEAYIAELYRAEGYQASIDQIIQGACVDHEVDVVLLKEKMTTYVEAKFHNTAGFKTDLKTALYVKARIDDIRAARESLNVRGLIVTNTKFTSKAVQFSTCAGVDLLAWEYPHKGNLHDRIDAAGLYPVTALTTLSHREKASLLNEKVVLCKVLGQESDALSRAGIKGSRAAAVLQEVGVLCVPGKDI